MPSNDDRLPLMVARAVECRSGGITEEEEEEEGMGDGP
jgi:hypothetical protein